MPFARQPDLFAAAGVQAAHPVPSQEQRPRLVPNDLDDAALIAAIPGAGLADCHALAAEAGRRRLAAAVHPLEAPWPRLRGVRLRPGVPGPGGPPAPPPAPPRRPAPAPA